MHDNIRELQEPSTYSRYTDQRKKTPSGVQTRAMAQWVDNEANPEQVHKTTDRATTPTVELHRTKEDTIKEFV